MAKASINPNSGNKRVDINNNKHKPYKFLKIFYQNICGLQNKIDELLISLNQDLPEIVCISEHHLEQYQLYKTNLQNYALGTGYCRTKHKKGGSCIFILKGFYFEEINISNFCLELDIEACGINLHLKNFNIYSITRRKLFTIFNET